MQPDSPEKGAQDHREATTLMVFHPSPEDIPPTPKEPSASGEEETASEVLQFGEPPDHVKVFSNPLPNPYLSIHFSTPY